MGKQMRRERLGWEEHDSVARNESPPRTVTYKDDPGAFR
ncbi:hypothetical protein TGAM01_v204895 [Trichoderma gamsii]|uniref:Uncharacterized protein n=1 Tax=Trichoderma gamsii TaxID=398673 RepID=A0A2P4ZQ43_9HYPO|nr:hypothetical protein TGAM01_v204895 [Trichoderma gamsii]PON26419.1 hypothetical protein TGAM01_v204895 [Trichoderma gamsii]